MSCCGECQNLQSCPNPPDDRSYSSFQSYQLLSVVAVMKNRLSSSFSCFSIPWGDQFRAERRMLASIWTLNCVGTAKVSDLIHFLADRSMFVSRDVVMTNLLTFSSSSFSILYRNPSRAKRITLAAFQAQDCAAILGIGPKFVKSSRRYVICFEISVPWILLLTVSLSSFSKLYRNHCRGEK